MISALSGFALIGTIVLAGWLARRWAGLPANAETVLGRISYSVLSPCLLFAGAARADMNVLFSEPLLVSTAAAVLCFALHTPFSRHSDRPTRIVGAMAGGYTNAMNIGLPIATYVLGDPALVVPIVVLQLLIIMPVALTLLEVTTTGHASWRITLTAPLRNPMVVAVLLGAVASLTGRHLPTVLMNPIDVIGAAAVPTVLIAFGMSLSGRRVLAAGPDRVPTIAAVALKVAGMPAVAFLLATAVGLPAASTYAVTVLAGLPTAQNVFLSAQFFDAGRVVARDAVFLSTLLCVPALLLNALLFSL